MPTHQTSRPRAFGHWPWVLPAILCAAGAVAPPALLVRLNDGAADLLRRAVPLSRPDPRIVIVDVDERSLSVFGQWPWRRDRLGALVDRLRALGARTIALDLVFSEPDRATPAGDSGDEAFADSLRRGRVVLGYAMTFGVPSDGEDRCVLQPLPVTIVEPEEAEGEWPMFAATGAVCSLPALTTAAGASGFLNATPDSDGILRRVPLAIQLQGRVYPSLALSAALATLDAPVGELHAVHANATSLKIGDREVALDGRANLLLRFRGGRRTFPFVSAVDVMDARTAADTFRDKLVFVGATALGVQELVATPHDPRFIGVEVQATVADNLLRSDFLRRPAEATLIEAGLTLAAAGLVALAAARYGAAGGALAGLACLVALWGGAWWLLGRWGLLLSPILPSASVALASAGVALATTSRTSRDASADLQRARAEVDAAAHAHGEFLTRVSRELRTPLAAIQGYARMIGRGALADDRKAQALAAVERHAVAQTRVIDDLFEASRAAAGRIRLRRQAVQLADAVRAAADATTPAREARQIALGLDVDAEIDPVPGDPERLRQVVWHLLSNAVKFTPVGGRVDVSLARAGDGVELVVRDTGAGIAPAALPHLFTSRPPASNGPYMGGIGLGLPLVRQLVELHGGSVSAESDGPGLGATFRVRLPLAAEPATADNVPFVPPRLEGVRVVIEDERASERGRLASVLLEAGASVVTAASSHEALLLMRDDTRDVLVVSVGGGPKNGYWLAREALAVALNRGERLAVVAMGSADHADERALSGVAIDRYLQAPVDAAQLVSVIADVARNGSHHAH
ncbi:MAG TPA: CHASE2 domain-containing protein [Vicinamibacterales bacterium]|nr:CHASE2 domain-containing protein [Vicinamibacterales bacterium]